MRAIRVAIGTVDQKITESNSLNSARHERMNLVDAGLASAKKALNDSNARTKAALQAAANAADKNEAIHTNLQAIEARINKMETDIRAKEARERERKRIQTEKDEAAAATVPASTAAAAIAGASTAAAAASSSLSGSVDLSSTGVLPASSDPAVGVADPLRAAMDDRIRRERAKVKLMFRALEGAVGDCAAATATLASRIDALDARENKARRARDDDKKKAAEEDAARAAREDKLSADIAANAAKVEAVQSLHKDLESSLASCVAAQSESRAELAATLSASSTQLFSSLAAHKLRLDGLDASLASTSAVASSAAAAASLAASAASSQAEAQAAAAQLRQDLEDLATKTKQNWTVLQPCNKDVAVSKTPPPPPLRAPRIAALTVPSEITQVRLSHCVSVVVCACVVCVCCCFPAPRGCGELCAK